MQVTQAFTILGSHLYTLTFTTLTERGDALAPTISKMIDSFQVDQEIANKPKGKPGEFTEYKQPGNLFSFKYPANWEQRDPPNASVTISFSDPEAHFNFLDNVNVGYRQLPAEVNVEDVVTASIQSLAKQFEDFKLVENSKIEVDGISGRRLIYTGKRGTVPAEIDQIFV